MPTHPTARKLFTGEAINQVSASHLKNNTPLSKISNKTTRYEVAISRANKAVWAGSSLSDHAKAVQNAKDTFDGLTEKERLANSAKARKKAVVDRANDSKKWNDVIAKGYEQSTPSLSTQTVSPVNWDNVSQKEYTKALRAGEVNIATALLNQRTPGGYKGANTVNVENFLSERGYDINNPQSILIVFSNLKNKCRQESRQTLRVLWGTLETRQTFIQKSIRDLVIFLAVIQSALKNSRQVILLNLWDLRIKEELKILN